MACRIFNVAQTLVDDPPPSRANVLSARCLAIGSVASGVRLARALLARSIRRVAPRIENSTDWGKHCPGFGPPNAVDLLGLSACSSAMASGLSLSRIFGRFFGSGRRSHFAQPLKSLLGSLTN